MSFGLDSDGLEIKRAADIKTELEDALKATFGKAVNLDSRSILGQVVGIVSEREALVWEIIEQIYNSQYPDTSEGNSLDNVVAITGTTRKVSTKSTGSVTLIGDVGINIPSGTVISVLGNSLSRFVTDALAIILAGTTEVQTITFDAVPDSGGWKLTFDGDESVALDETATDVDVKSALDALPSIDTVVVTGNFSTGFIITASGQDILQPREPITVTSNTLLDGASPVVATVTETTEGIFPKVDVTVTAETAGEVQAPAGTLTVIETPISGWDTVSNSLDIDVGSDVETDQSLKLRRLSEIAIAGKATLEAIRSSLLAITEVTAVVVFENNSTLTDINGRPPHSLDIVVENGDSSEIALTIFNTVAAGIQTIGLVTELVTDSQGFSHTIKYSRPDDILIYLDIDLTVDSNLFPVDGAALVEALVVSFGDSVGIGNDIIVYPQLLCSFATIPGILDVVIRIASAVIPVDGAAVVVPSDSGGDLLLTTGAAHGLLDNNKVTFTTTGALPTGVGAGIVYHLVSTTSTTLKLATIRGGTPIVFSDVGSGVHTMSFGGRDDNISISSREVASFDTTRTTVTVI